jgi:hypothetical protein
LLLLGSTISIAGIGGVSQHLKLIFREAGFNEQARLDAVFGWTLMAMLTAGAAGRFLFAWGAERFPKRQVISVDRFLRGEIVGAGDGDHCAGEHGGADLVPVSAVVTVGGVGKLHNSLGGHVRVCINRAVGAGAATGPRRPFVGHRGGVGIGYSASRSRYCNWPRRST